MADTIRPPDDVYWYYRRLASQRQVGAECTSKEDGCRYRVREDRVICRVYADRMEETIDSIPLKLPAGAKVMTGAGWGFQMSISVYYQSVIGPSNTRAGKRKILESIEGKQ
jgi:hypothetical protein